MNDGLSEFLAANRGPLLIAPNELRALDARYRAVARQAASQSTRTRPGASLAASSGRVAVLSLRGLIEQRSTFFGELLGGTSTERFKAAFDAALRDPGVSGILIDVDSPGGSSGGVQELSDHIYNSRGVKPIYSLANSMAASASYWIPTAADRFYATPGAVAGSIGVYLLHADESKLWEQVGINWTFIQAGTFKTDGNEFQPLSDSAREEMQAIVDSTYARFVAGVARNRGVKVSAVEAKFGQGRVFPAQQAHNRGMIDGIATFDQVVNMLANKASMASSSARSSTPSAEVLRLRQAHRQRIEAQSDETLALDAWITAHEG